MATEVVESKTDHTEVNIHSAAVPMPSASQSNGAVTRLAAASPALSQTVEITGTSQTPIVVAPVARCSSDRLADVPEEVHQRNSCACHDRGAEGDNDPQLAAARQMGVGRVRAHRPYAGRNSSEEHTYELQSLM